VTRHSQVTVRYAVAAAEAPVCSLWAAHVNQPASSLLTFTTVRLAESASSLVHVSNETRSHPEMVGDMSLVTLNFDLSKIPFVHF